MSIVLHFILLWCTKKYLYAFSMTGVWTECINLFSNYLLDNPNLIWKIKLERETFATLKKPKNIKIGAAYTKNQIMLDIINNQILVIKEYAVQQINLKRKKP